MATTTHTASSSAVKLEEVDCNCIEVEVATTDMFLLEPLKDHNYISTEIIKPNFTKQTTKRIIRKKPKITSLTLLFNCVICGYATTKREVFNKHTETHAKITESTKYVPCDSCNINKGAPKGYQKCPHCSYYAKNIASLRVHMHIHNSGTAYKCTECAFYGKDLKELISHMKNSKSIVCDSCPFSSHVKDRVVKHQKKHADKTKSVNTNDYTIQAAT